MLVFKGQLISKCLFGTYLQFSQKMNENNSTSGIITSSKVEFFCSFFGRIEDMYQKRHFDINWSLDTGLARNGHNSTAITSRHT